MAGGCSGYFKVSGIGAPMRSKASRWVLVGSARKSALSQAGGLQYCYQNARGENNRSIGGIRAVWMQFTAHLDALFADRGTSLDTISQPRETLYILVITQRCRGSPLRCSLWESRLRMGMH